MTDTHSPDDRTVASGAAADRGAADDPMKRQPTSTMWEWARNPAYAGRAPAPLDADCHDKSPFITIICGCGGEMHVHETQVAGVQPGQGVVASCKSCDRPLVFEPGWFAFVFADLRRRGWLAS